MRQLFLPVLAALVAGSAQAVPPSGLTGWRTPQGIFLSWSASGTGVRGQVGVWRGTEPGSLAMLAQLPSGQAGFLDLGAQKNQGYAYALGDDRKPGPPVLFPAPGKTSLFPSLVTTCGGLFKGKYPADARNYFQSAKDSHVQFFGMYLVRPFDSTSRQVKIVWRDPAGEVFSELEQGIVPQRVDMQKGEPAGRIVVAQAVGLRESLPQNGQQRVPVNPGLYSIEVSIDDVPASITIFFVLPSASPGGKSSDAAPAPSEAWRTSKPQTALTPAPSEARQPPPASPLPTPAPSDAWR
jgi:hypothetical protein